MGCDIHIFTEVKKENNWELFKEDFFTDSYNSDNKEKSPFKWRSYGVFAFLADVRNYSAIKGFKCKFELPEDCSQEVLKEYEYWEIDAHSCSWLTAKELIDFDYSKTLNDRRVTRQISPNIFNGAITGTEQEGTLKTYSEFLGDLFMKQIEELKILLDKYEDVRLVFWFDN